MGGKRQIRRYVPELDAEGYKICLQRTFANLLSKWLLARANVGDCHAVVWFILSQERVPGSELSTNFLIVAPNVIVYQRWRRTSRAMTFSDSFLWFLRNGDRSNQR